MCEQRSQTCGGQGGGGGKLAQLARSQEWQTCSELGDGTPHERQPVRHMASTAQLAGYPRVPKHNSAITLSLLSWSAVMPCTA
jgi:hypothetical protein